MNIGLSFRINKQSFRWCFLFIFLASFYSVRAQLTWTDSEIGAPTPAGSSSYNAGTQVYTVTGGGTFIGNNYDSCHFVSTPTYGSLEISAHLATQQNTGTQATAGLMIRESTAGNATEAYIAATPTNGLVFTVRSQTGAGATITIGNNTGAPVWLKLIRSATPLQNGTTTPFSYKITGYYSSDGTIWNVVGSQTISTMSPSVLMGIGVCSNNSSMTSTATFDHLNAFGNVPQSSTSLLAWYRADLGVVSGGGLVSKWQDQSGNGNDAQQSVTANQPALIGNAINNTLPVVRFNSTSITSLVAPYTAALNSSQVTVIAVARKTTSTTYNAILSRINAGAGPYFLSIAGSTTPEFGIANGGVTATGSLGSGVFGVLEGVYDQVSARLYVNGSLAQSSAYTTALASVTTPLQIGEDGNGAYGFDGDIAELFVFNQGLSDLSRLHIESYLYQKYGVGTEPTAPAATLGETANTIYSTAQSFSIAPSDSGETVYYTVDGSDPSSSSTRFTVTSPTYVTISSTTTLKLYSTEPGFLGNAQSFTFTDLCITD